jgi:transcription elongation factor GreB
MHFLTHRLKDAVVVDPTAPRADPKKVFFGAIVDVEDEDGERATYRIVGEDEIDSSNGRISYKSPIGRALLGKRVDDVITVRRPSGEVELSIVAVRYV